MGDMLSNSFQNHPKLIEAILRGVRKELSSQINSTSNEILTRKETAELFKVSLVTIHEWIKTGKIHPYKIGNRTYFKRSELMETLNQSNPKDDDGAK